MTEEWHEGPCVRSGASRGRRMQAEGAGAGRAGLRGLRVTYHDWEPLLVFIRGEPHSGLCFGKTPLPSNVSRHWGGGWRGRGGWGALTNGTPFSSRLPRRAVRLNSESRPLRASWRRRTQRPYPSSYRPPVQAAGSPSTTSTSPLHRWWLWSTCLSTAPMGSSWQRMSQPCSPGCAGPKQQTRASERCRSQRTRSRMEGSFLTTAPRRSIFPAWPFLAGHVGAPKTHPPGARHRLDASAGRQSAAGAL